MFVFFVVENLHILREYVICIFRGILRHQEGHIDLNMEKNMLTMFVCLHVTPFAKYSILLFSPPLCSPLSSLRQIA